MKETICCPKCKNEEIDFCHNFCIECGNSLESLKEEAKCCGTKFIPCKDFPSHKYCVFCGSKKE